MKKILCIILVLCMLNVFIIPTSAVITPEDFENYEPDDSWKDSIPLFSDPFVPGTPEYGEEEKKLNWQHENIEPGEYINFFLSPYKIWTLAEGDTVSFHGSFQISSSTEVNINGILIGTVTDFDFSIGTTINVGDNGRMELNCLDSDAAKALAEKLRDMGLFPEVTENKVLVRKYSACHYNGHQWNEKGECNICGTKYECNHNWVSGKCTECGLTCTHNWVNRRCSICGMSETMYRALMSLLGQGSILSEGNIWIVIAGAVVIVGGIVAIVIVNKKKKSHAKGEKTTDDTEKTEE